MTPRLTRRAFIGSSLLAPLLLGSCGGQTDAAQPPEITYGRDTCVRCGMIISDERFAAALVAPDGSVRLFDDAGEMLTTVTEEALEGQRAWVHDRHGAQWIDATTATYALGAPETTPMGTGYVAFARREDAETFAAQPDSLGQVWTWPEAIARGAHNDGTPAADDQE
ncbi:MAG: nitrous oxide reductase accessory protein NosL [Thermomicrobiales bacterium]|nr:nitrous oxide reductase accessory protein NosL [Thermomicrobiales bacterium]